MFQVALSIGEEELGNPASDIVIVLSLTAGQLVGVQPTRVDSIYGADLTWGMCSWFSAHIVHAI